MLQRVFDENGLTTISITTLEEYTRMVKPSLALFVAHPFGLTLGDVNDEQTQNSILIEALKLTEEEHPPGTIVNSDYKWDVDDLRDLQLQKRRK